jgi:hypothetical protein
MIWSLESFYKNTRAKGIATLVQTERYGDPSATVLDF